MDDYTFMVNQINDQIIESAGPCQKVRLDGGIIGYTYCAVVGETITVEQKSGKMFHGTVTKIYGVN